MLPKSYVLMFDNMDIVWEQTFKSRYLCTTSIIAEDLGELIVEDLLTESVIHRSFVRPTFDFWEKPSSETIREWKTICVAVVKERIDKMNQPSYEDAIA